MASCECCGDSHTGSYGSGRFCSPKCARRFSTKDKRSEINKKVSESLKGRPWSEFENRPEKKPKPKVTRPRPKTIFDVSKRTMRKIMVRLGIACSICGWDKGSCDVHHIVPRKDGGSNDHSNLTYVCPNCHRLLHEGKIQPKMTLAEQIDEDWMKYYYG